MAKPLDESSELYLAIGEFIFWFSQLEFTIKARLAGGLNLERGLFDIIIGPYDFVMLCTVTERTLSVGADEATQRRIKSYFGKCKKLNQESRIVVAHGNWTTSGARHVSRQTLQAQIHFESPAEIRKAAKTAKQLMGEIFTLGAVHR